MKTKTFLLNMLYSGIIIMLLVYIIRQPAQKQSISFPKSDTTFIHKEGNTYYTIQISPLDVNNIPKQN